MVKCGIVLDGYTVDHVLPEGDEYPEVKFSYRPLSKLEFVDFNNRLIKTNETPNRGEEIAIEILLKHLVSWDLKDHNGNDVKIDKDTLAKLRTTLSKNILNVVMGYDAVTRASQQKN